MASIPIAKADFIEGMAKGMAVLESFDTERQRLNATLAAQRTGLTRAAARRHLLTLAHLGYLETDGSYFWLAPKVLRFLGSYLASAWLPRVLQPTLNRLAAQAHPTSTGRVLLAALPPAELTAWLKNRPLHRLTPQTITQVGPLRQVITKVRRDDYCLAVEEHELGVHALAVPLRNLQGHTVAALNVVASPKQMDEGSLQREMLPLLQDAARELRGLL